MFVVNTFLLFSISLYIIHIGNIRIVYTIAVAYNNRAHNSTNTTHTKRVLQ